MARCLVHILLDVAEGATSIAAKFPPTVNNPHGNVRVAEELLRAIGSGSLSGNVYTLIEGSDGVASVATIACTRANASGDSVTLSGIVLTEATDFLRGASDTTCGANLAAAINAHDVLKRLYVATAATGTVTLTARLPGLLMGGAAITTSDATAFAIVLPTTRVSIVCVQANAATDTVTIMGVTLTEGSDFARGASDSDCATALAAAINANATLAALGVAKASSATVTLDFGRNTAAVTATTNDATAFIITRPATHGSRGTVTRAARNHTLGRGLP